MQAVLDDKRNLFLDMDGTLLDLAFDNAFWMQHLPAAYGRRERLTPAAARAVLDEHYRTHAGTLNWYCLDFWTDLLGIDVLALKRTVSHEVRYLPGAEAFLRAARRRGFRLVLVTNAHRATLELKDAVTGVTRHFDAVHSSHDFGYPKEQARFWESLAQAEPHRPEETLFVDDSAAVLTAAAAAGLPVVAISRPDSRQPLRTVPGLPAVTGVAELLAQP